MREFKKTPIFAIYTPPKKGSTYDKTTAEFRALYDRPGVYIIFRKGSDGVVRPIYVGKAFFNVAKSCLRHFYFYNDARTRAENAGEGRLRVSFEKEKRNPDKFFVRFFYLEIDTKEEKPTEAEQNKIDEKEQELVNTLGPKYNTNLKTGEIDIDLALREQYETEARSAAGRYNEYAEEYKEYQEAKEEQPEGVEPLEEPPF